MELAAGDFFSLIHTSWNGYTKNAVKKSNPEHVIIIGKGVAKIIENDLRNRLHSK
jgi:putative cell wall-binding protein